MSEDQPKKGFWGGLFRRASQATKLAKDRPPPRRASDSDAPLPRRASEAPPRRDSGQPLNSVPLERSGTRRRPRRPDPASSKGKGRENGNGHVYEPGPLTEWPPSGVSSKEELSLGHAMELISRGVPAFKGEKRAVPHASDHYYALFTTTAGNKGDETDTTNQHDSMTQLMTLRIQGPGSAVYAWETLEQPSYAFYFGKRPGTVTLSHWASLSSVLPPAIPLRDPGVAPREVDLATIFARLSFLEGGLEDDDPDLMYKNLYKRLLRDPDKGGTPHRTLDKQITDLIMVLSKGDWIDFTVPKNQIATRFIFDNSLANQAQYTAFFMQLLLGVELDLRITSRHHNDQAKEKLLLQLPPTMQWTLALARRWKENIRVESYGSTPDQIKLRYKLKRRQAKMLKRFAQMMKWPNLAATLDTLKRRDRDSTLDLISSHAMAFFSGLVLPGATFPFLIMNSLIDVDPDKATDDLALLTHLQPYCGFQYRNSYTYWTSMSIVGKVLAPTCHEVAGWVGPARPTVDLGRSQIARIRCRRPKQVLTPDDIRSMSERSDPLGPPTEVYPVSEYKLVTPDLDDGDMEDLVRVELLSLRRAADREADPGPTWFDASVQFAIDGVSWALRLSYDVSYVCAWPCSDGPHPLFFDYVFERARPDELIRMKGWSGTQGGASAVKMTANEQDSASSSPDGAGPAPDKGKGKAPAAAVPAANTHDDEKVLVVEAFGVPDNEVLARAWCSHWGLSAVVADVSKTCMACAIREAYAATITIVILVDDQGYRNDD